MGLTKNDVDGIIGLMFADLELDVKENNTLEYELYFAKINWFLGDYPVMGGVYLFWKEYCKFCC